jgi:hypothetical protein
VRGIPPLLSQDQTLTSRNCMTRRRFLSNERDLSRWQSHSRDTAPEQPPRAMEELLDRVERQATLRRARARQLRVERQATLRRARARQLVAGRFVARKLRAVTGMWPPCARWKLSS